MTEAREPWLRIPVLHGRWPMLAEWRSTGDLDVRFDWKAAHSAPVEYALWQTEEADERNLVSESITDVLANAEGAPAAAELNVGVGGLWQGVDAAGFSIDRTKSAHGGDSQLRI